MTISDGKALRKIKSWTEDWNRFVRDALKARLDREQQDIISSVQYNPMTAVASGTARGKDFVAACASLCFMYLTPRWKDGKLTKNTKIAMTAPTARQVQNIMIPEISHGNISIKKGHLAASLSCMFLAMLLLFP